MSGDGAGNLLATLAEIAARLAATPMARIDEAVTEVLGLLAGVLGLDHGSLWKFTDARAVLSLTHGWNKAGLPALQEMFDAGQHLPWCYETLANRGSLHFSDVGELPAEAAPDEENLRSCDIKSCLMIALVADREVFGVLAFVATETPHRWSGEEVSGLKLAAAIIGGMLCRQRAALARIARDSVVGKLAAEFAHELNQPLTAILGNAQAARRFLTSGTMDPAELSEIMDDIITANKTAGGLVHELRVRIDEALNRPSVT